MMTGYLVPLNGRVQAFFTDVLEHFTKLKCQHIADRCAPAVSAETEPWRGVNSIKRYPHFQSVSDRTASLLSDVFCKRWGGATADLGDRNGQNKRCQRVNNGAAVTQLIHNTSMVFTCILMQGYSVCLFRMNIYSHEIRHQVVVEIHTLNKKWINIHENHTMIHQNFWRATKL